VKRLILVDTRHKSRIGIAAELVDRGVEVHVYDHQPHMKGDVVADQEVFEEVGATVSILADIIKKRRIKLSSLEATVMLVGIYEETGSLTYRSTTKLDVDMVSFLLSQGANLSVVSSYLNRELTESELTLLTRLIATTERIEINGVSVSSIVLTDVDYIGELGALLHKLMDIENIPLLFVFIQTKNGRVDIVGRSKLPSVDLNSILSAFGGGGHPAAACAKIPGGDLEKIKAKLWRALKSSIKIKAWAKDIMSKDLEALSADTRIDVAKGILAKAQAGGAPVRHRGRIVGIITTDGVNKALKSGYGHARVKGYMTRNIVFVKPEAPLYEIQKLMLSKDAGVVLVSSGKRILGVIKRTDALKAIHESLFTKPSGAERQEILNLTHKMDELLPREVVAMSKRIGSLANSTGLTAFLVGGVVRDILLGVKNLDLDIVVEGDAIKLGSLLAKELGAALVVHKRFGTCTVFTKGKLRIDLATARKETYERPAALPTVEFSSLKDDLIRRDFTINAMAISLNKNSFGQLVDFFKGREDLARGRIRVMHDGSFIDDPTRIFRAVRFEQRLGFAIDSHTADLIKHAVNVKMFSQVEPQRIRDEIVLILKEEDPLKALKRMSQLHEFRFLHRKISLTKDFLKMYEHINLFYSWYEVSPCRKRTIELWLVYLMALFEPLSYNDVSRICRSFVFRRGESLRLVSYKKCADKTLVLLSSSRDLSPSSVYRVLEPLSLEAILAIMAKAKVAPHVSRASRAVSRIKDFLERYNGQRLSIRGEDLKAMGLEPGPGFRNILKKVLYEKIDGNLKTKADERRFAENMVSALGMRKKS
ncbi:MAG: CBS domain-containing protein, partial [Candidatus Omnitrophica bacterium]|nr:CBS domain-containing protein [Candidatus Omnitrophota bacterium]